MMMQKAKMMHEKFQLAYTVESSQFRNGQKVRIKAAWKPPDIE